MLQRGRPRTVIHSVCKGQLTNRFFLKDRRSFSDQISFILTSNRRGFLRSRATMRVKSQSEKIPLSVTKALAEATLSSMSFHILRYLLALARGRFSPDTDAAPGGAPGAAAFSDGVLPLGSPK